MVTGAVSALRFPSITIELIDGAGRSRAIDAHRDTGFNAELGIKLLDRSNY